jgi:hypothetical protein
MRNEKGSNDTYTHGGLAHVYTPRRQFEYISVGSTTWGPFPTCTNFLASMPALDPFISSTRLGLVFLASVPQDMETCKLARPGTRNKHADILRETCSGSEDHKHSRIKV